MMNVNIGGQIRQFENVHELAEFMYAPRKYTLKEREAVTQADDMCRRAGGLLVSRQAIAAILMAVPKPIDRGSFVL